jgi:hypothetical protein
MIFWFARFILLYNTCYITTDHIWSYCVYHADIYHSAYYLLIASLLRMYFDLIYRLDTYYPLLIEVDTYYPYLVDWWSLSSLFSSLFKFGRFSTCYDLYIYYLWSLLLFIPFRDCICAWFCPGIASGGDHGISPASEGLVIHLVFIHPLPLKGWFASLKGSLLFFSYDRLSHVFFIHH